ncbi:transporter substrate-binding domain-containing protein [Christiangramia echinicola]|uniref:Membrane-bound lytic murein transglycosylase F n=1 Tax=Christiangramia echinicola TaxID=279359 RepID=A0A1H1QXA3_9FLAO|nr:transporter substrate-binding domain-containing protein [Christiangramia echinicola]SDS27519.1 membrane-bound lytic murein transglycosylase F [Christiangramia echinicola]
MDRKINVFFITVLLILSGCSKGSRNPGKEDGFFNNNQEDAPYHISKDLESIKEDGVLHAITIYNSTSYFLYKGRPMGFEYELLSRLAEDLDLELKITVADNINDLFDMLNNGEGDLIAFGLTITEPRKKLVSFTKNHYVTHQTLVQKMPDNWRSLPGYKIDRQLISNTIELMNDTVWVRENSSYAERLKNLQDEMGSEIPVEYIDGNITTDEIIKMVVDGEIERTVADYNIASINKTFYPVLDIDTRISFAQRIAWAVRQNSPELLNAINNWITMEKKRDEYYVIYNKYFKNKKSYRGRIQSDFYSKNSNKISKYDDIIKNYASDIGWDWRFLSSQVYQESGFDPRSVSWAGASGLIQLMPETAKEVGVNNSFDPNQNIKGGVKYLNRVRERFENVEDSIQKIKFTLAAFNCGPGHVLDAMRLAEKNGKDPNIWDDNVEEYILRLSEKKYYLDEVVRHGYARGSEPYNYVRDIFLRYEHYKQFIAEETELAMSEQDQNSI